ncbi:hypothetical protein [Actinomyces qiguomingii]|uniref:hypothetical protein n=2 Tax=Actinomyces qiguomingii TaxID=2057800 RepID=UPI000FFEA8A1|nr:hypothetical protein [Actinomyces qiguomingii]
MTTAVAGQDAIVATRVTSPLLADGGLVVRLSLPDPNPGFSPAALWGEEPDGEVVLREAGQWGAVVERRLDATTYRVTLCWDAPATADLTDARTLVLAPAHGTATLGVVAAFAPVSGPGSELYAAPATPPDDVDAVLASSAAFWEEYWRSGAAVELAGSTDSRAAELERRIVLSQYLLRAGLRGRRVQVGAQLVGGPVSGHRCRSGRGQPGGIVQIGQYGIDKWCRVTDHQVVTFIRALKSAAELPPTATSRMVSSCTHSRSCVAK